MLRDWLKEEKLRGFGSRQAASYASGTLWPHGEFSMGWAKERPDGGDWHEQPIAVSPRAEKAILDDIHGGPWPLDLSVPANSHTPAKRGHAGITGYGQQMVKAAGHLMQERWPQHRKTLGTITLPEMSQAARREVVAAWPEIVRQLLQWQSRRLKRLGVPEAIVSVSEIQPKRLAESGQACLHLHQLWLNVPAKSGRYSFSPNVIRSYMSRLLMRLCPSYSWGFINVDVKPVEGVVASYLAKYMSKGKQAIAEALEDWGVDNHPSTWWNMNKPTRDMVKTAVKKGREVGSALEALVYWALTVDTEEVMPFLAPCMVDFDNSRIIMGWRGRLDPVIHRGLTEVLQSFDIERFRGGKKRCQSRVKLKRRCSPSWARLPLRNTSITR